MKTKQTFFSLFHINSCSLNKNFEDLEYFLKTTNKKFDVIAISESRIIKNSKKCFKMFRENVLKKYYSIE